MERPRCFDCDKEFEKGEKVYEFTVGAFDGDCVISDTMFEQWCEACELKRAEK